MALDAPTARDEVFEQEGITVVIAKGDLARTGAIRVDVLGDVLVAIALGG
jgi:hypothetical protein